MATDIVARLKLRAEEFSRSLKSEFGKIDGEAEAAGKRAGEKFGRNLGIGISAGAIAIGAAITKSLDYAVALKNEARQVGVNTDELQKYRYAAGQVGIAQDKLDDGLAKLNERIGAAIAGNKDARKTFADLGIGIVDVNGNARSTGEVFLEMVKRISAIHDPATRANELVKTFGESGRQLDPLLAGGIDQVNNLARAADELGVVMSRKEIQEADEAARKLGQVKAVLEANIARTVAQNADSIIKFADSLSRMASGLAAWWAQNPAQAYSLMGAMAGGRIGGAPGAVIGAGAGYLFGKSDERAAADANMNIGFRTRQREAARREVEARREAANSPGSLFRVRRGNGTSGTVADAEREYRRQEDLFNRAVNATLPSWRGGAPGGGGAGGGGVILQPAAGGGGRSGGGGGGGSRRSANDNDRAAKEAIENERRLLEWAKKTTEEQQLQKRLADMRAKGLDQQADLEEELGRIRAQHPEIDAKSVEELGKQLGITRALTAEERQRLQTLLDMLKAIKDGTAETVRNEHIGAAMSRGAAAARKSTEEAAKHLKKETEEIAREQERVFSDVADFYEDLFSGRTGDIWKDFKRQGLRAVAEIAAAWTLSQITGQKFDLGAMVSQAGGVFGMGGGSPVGTLLGGLGGLFGQKGGGRSIVMGGGALVDAGKTIGGAAGAGGALGGIGGAISSAAPYAAAALLAVSVLGGALKSTKRGSATLGMDAFGELGVGSTRGNSSSRIQAASGGIGNVADMLDRIAEALGGEVTGAGSVSIGVRKNSWRVDPTGSGITKTSRGAIDFGQDEEAAIRYAVGEAIKDGVIGGISDAAMRILQSGQDIETAIDKALAIEEIPKLLRQRLDPLGAALDELDTKFATLAETLKEGGASAEQIAQARELWELERADAIKQIGDASASLKDFLKSLRIGGDSPLSLRQQSVDAAAALAPFEAQIRAAETARATADDLQRRKAAGEQIDDATLKAAMDAAAAASGKIDQEGFANAAQALLGIDRQMNGSRSAFFDQFDRIQALTNSAISLVDKAVPLRDAAKDPFAELTASNTAQANNLLEQQSDQLARIEELLAAIAANGGGGGGGSFIGDARSYLRSVA